MEFESKITSFAGGLLLLGSYMMLLDVWDFSGLIVVTSSLLLLLVAFRDHRPQRADIIGLLAAALLSIFFFRELDNSTYISLGVLLIFALVAINAKPEAFLPSLAGLVALEFFDPAILMKGFNLIFSNLSPLLGIRYGINDLGYLILYHSQTHLPIVIDETKLLLPFYISMLISQLALLTVLAIDRRAAIKSVFIITAITFLFVIITFKNLISNPATAALFPSDIQALALPGAYLFLISALTPGSGIKRLQKGVFTSKSLTIPLLIGLFIVALLYYTPITARSDPLVIIDETHSEWEPSWTDYVKTNEKDPISGINNYYGLLNMLSSLYNVTLIIDKPAKRPAVSLVSTVLTQRISLETLENISGGRRAVLILKCPTSPYTEADAEAVMKFVEKGNGLILIGEHTDVYGICTSINPVAEKLGYRFLPTGVQDILTEYRGSMTQRGELPPLISRYMTGAQLWETSDSLEKLNGSKTIFDVFTRPIYFAHYRNETAAFSLTREFTEEVKLNSLFGRHLVIAGVKHGEGKAILFTDSTDFNNGMIGFGDHAQLFIGMVEYVAQREWIDKELMLPLLLAIALILVALNRRTAVSTVLMISVLLLTSYTFSYPLAHYTAQFPDLKTEPRTAILTADQSYIDDYFSGGVDVEKLMDKYFKKNLTALIIEEPSGDWSRIGSRAEKLADVIDSI